MPGSMGSSLDDLDEGSLLVEDQAFAIVSEWAIAAEVSDAAFRVYLMLLRFGGTSGCRMPSRALLGRRLHRSVDSIDRALRELVPAGIVRIEHRHGLPAGGQVHPIEDKVMQLKARKLALFASVMGDGDALGGAVTAEEIAGLLEP